MQRSKKLYNLSVLFIVCGVLNSGCFIFHKNRGGGKEGESYNSLGANGSGSFSDSLSSPSYCESSKEFITIYEFLKASENYFPGGEGAIKLAQKSSQGCSGAAKRFINSVQVLAKLQLTTKDILERATSLAQKSDGEVDSFLYVLMTAYASDGFDYDLQRSLNLAERFSLQFKGPRNVVKNDFEKMVKICLNSNEIPLTPEQCSQLTQKLILSMEKHETPVSGAFVDAFNFLKSEKGPHLILGEALPLATEIVVHHPRSVFDFISTYEYALSQDGLKLSKGDALKLAKQVALSKRWTQE